MRNRKRMIVTTAIDQGRPVINASVGDGQRFRVYTEVSRGSMARLTRLANNSNYKGVIIDELGLALEIWLAPAGRNG